MAASNVMVTASSVGIPTPTVWGSRDSGRGIADSRPAWMTGVSALNAMIRANEMAVSETRVVPRCLLSRVLSDANVVSTIALPFRFVRNIFSPWGLWPPLRGHAEGDMSRAKDSPCVPSASYRIRQAPGGKGQVEGGPTERVDQPTGLQHRQRAGDRCRRMARPIDQFLDGAAPLEQVAQELTLNLRQRVDGWRLQASCQTDLMQQRGAGGNDRRLLVGDQPVAAARAHRVDRAGDGIQLAPDGGRRGGGHERAGTIRRVDNHDRLGEAGDDAVASGEVRTADGGADRDLAHERATRAEDLAGERPMPWRVDAIDRRG